MKKSLIENMMVADQNQLKIPARKNKVAFLALKDDISEALEKGWSVTVIWETLRDEGSIISSYNTFRLYVLKYLNGQKPGYSQKDAIEQRPMRLVENQAKKTKTLPMPSFKFNPVPNPEDLF